MKYAPDFPNGPNTPPEYVEAWAILNVIFRQLRETTISMEAQLGAIIIPERLQAHERYYQKSANEYVGRYGLTIATIAWNYAAPDQALIKLFSTINIPTLDLLPIYRAYDATHSLPLYFERDRHLNQAGHQLTAEAVCQWVVENNFIRDDLQSAP
jgi:hypothetical protein